MSTPTGRRAFLDAIDLPVRVIRQDFRALYFVAALISLVAVLPNALIQLISGQAQAATGALGLGAPLSVFALFFLSFFLTVIAQLTIYEGVRLSIDGEKVSLGACLRRGLHPFGVLTVLLGYVAALVGFFCLCVPGVVIGLGVTFSLALVAEGHYGIGVLTRSWDLMFYRWSEMSPSPMWLRAAGLLLVYYLIYTALSSLTTVPAAVLAFFVTMREAASGSGVSSEEIVNRMVWMQVFVTLLGGLAAAMTNLYAASAITLLFRQAREELEAPTIEAALEERLAASAGEPS